MATTYDGLDVTHKALAFAQRNPNAARYGGFWGRRTRREAFSGAMAVHSTEGLPDRILPDDGAANTVSYFGHSTRAASYHKIVDSDSIEVFLPWSAEAFHDATGGNRHSGGISMATQAHRWQENPDHDDRMIRNAARAAADGARYWASLAPGRDPMECARWITPAQYHARQPGLVEHGQLDPGRRSDPWTKHPFRPELRRRLVKYMAEELGDTPQEDVMNADQEKKLDDLATKVGALEEKLDTLSANLDVLAVGGHYQGHATEGAVPILTKLHRHLAGDQFDDKRTLRQIVEAIRNRVES